MPDFLEGARVQVGDRLGVVHRDIRTIAVRGDDGELGYFEPSAVQLVDQPAAAPEPDAVLVEYARFRRNVHQYAADGRCACRKAPCSERLLLDYIDELTGRSVLP